MGTLEEEIPQLTPTRIAVYDDYLSEPRVVDIQPNNITDYIEDITVKTYELSQQKGGSIPYAVIREVCENFIHARFKDPCISILNDGNTIKFTDQGPGIEDKMRAQQFGFTSATTEERQYIRGVGSGLPRIKEYLQITNGRLIIEDNIREGTVVTIQMNQNTPNQEPVIYRETLQENKNITQEISEREYNILVLASELGRIGPTDVEQRLSIPLATGHRALAKLEKLGLLQKNDEGKRIITDQGRNFLDR